jgi:FkbM family methyltransferase
MTDLTRTIRAHGRSYTITVDDASRQATDLRHGLPYERAVLEDASARFPDPAANAERVAVDVGASVGNHTLWYAAVCGFRVAAFEPHDGARDRLQRNAWDNGLVDRIAVDYVALADRTAMGAWDPHHRGRVAATVDGWLEMRTLDSYGLRDVALLKVDVEGAETAVLRGASETLERERPVVYAEARSRAARTRISGVLQPHGYALSTVIPVSSPVGVWEPIR